jgi:small subunit ribosomal protein S6
MNYEINFLILQSQTEDVAGIRNKVKELIKANEGTITDELTYQKRKLAYEIKHEQYGFFTVCRFDLEDGGKLKDLTKDLNLEKGVSRHIIVKSDEIPELQKEIGKAPRTEEERKAEAMKKAPKKKIGKKILDEISKETTEQVESKPAPKKEIAVETPTKPEQKEEIKKETKKNVKKVADQPSAGDKKEEISMDDLDKKLDEILDI